MSTRTVNSEELVKELEKLSELHFAPGFKKASFFVHELDRLLHRLPPKYRRRILHNLLLFGKWETRLPMLEGYRLEAKMLVHDIERILNHIPKDLQPYFQDIYNKLAVAENEIVKNPKQAVEKLENILNELKQEIIKQLEKKKIRKVIRKPEVIVHHEKITNYLLERGHFTVGDMWNAIEVWTPLEVKLNSEEYEKIRNAIEKAISEIEQYHGGWHWENTIISLLQKALSSVPGLHVRVERYWGEVYRGTNRDISGSGGWIIYINGHPIVFYSYWPTKQLVLEALRRLLDYLREKTRNITERHVIYKTYVEEVPDRELEEEFERYWRELYRRIERMVPRYLRPVFKYFNIRWNLV